MTTIFCTRCSAEVQDVGGFCLLGHPLKASPIGDALDELRAEVDKRFEDVRSELDSIDAHVDLASFDDPPVSAPPPPPPPSLPSPPAPPVALEDDEEDRLDPATLQQSYKKVWAELDPDAEVSADDPIYAFAPAGGMDWGPNRPGWF